MVPDINPRARTGTLIIHMHTYYTHTLTHIYAYYTHAHILHIHTLHTYHTHRALSLLHTHTQKHTGRTHHFTRKWQN